MNIFLYIFNITIVISLATVLPKSGALAILNKQIPQKTSLGVI